MLQQTGVSRVLERYDDFCERFPTPEACAAAPAGAVIQEWRGLGYNARALRLHAAARRITAAGGRFPDDLDGLLALPGVGPYTARAVLSLAFERDVGRRGHQRGAPAGTPRRAPPAPSEAQRAADRLVPAGQAWLWNQALFDLGATVCARRAPACARCPLRRTAPGVGEGPDPADGSAGVSASQAPFEGSDRQCRGRLVEALRSGPQPATAAAHLMGLERRPAAGAPHRGVTPARRPRRRTRRRSSTSRLIAGGCRRRAADGQPACRNRWHSRSAMGGLSRVTPVVHRTRPTSLPGSDRPQSATDCSRLRHH